VFHTVLHPGKNGSGVIAGSQHHRLRASGRHSQSGHRTRLNTSSSRTTGSVSAMRPVRL
jgi:hypothetical protein